MASQRANNILEEAPLMPGPEHEDRPGFDGYGYSTTESHGLGAENADCSPSSPPSPTQDGVLRIEAVSRTWSKTALVVAYMGFVARRFLLFLIIMFLLFQSFFLHTLDTLGPLLI